MAFDRIGGSDFIIETLWCSFFLRRRGMIKDIGARATHIKNNNSTSCFGLSWELQKMAVTQSKINFFNEIFTVISLCYLEVLAWKILFHNQILMTFVVWGMEWFGKDVCTLNTKNCNFQLSFNQFLFFFSETYAVSSLVCFITTLY